MTEGFPIIALLLVVLIPLCLRKENPRTHACNLEE